MNRLLNVLFSTVVIVGLISCGNARLNLGLPMQLQSVLNSNRIAHSREPPQGYLEISNPLWQMIFRASDLLTRTNRETQRKSFDHLISAIVWKTANFINPIAIVRLVDLQFLVQSLFRKAAFNGSCQTAAIRRAGGFIVVNFK